MQYILYMVYMRYFLLSNSDIFVHGILVIEQFRYFKERDREKQIQKKTERQKDRKGVRKKRES